MGKKSALVLLCVSKKVAKQVFYLLTSDRKTPAGASPIQTLKTQKPCQRHTSLHCWSCLDVTGWYLDYFAVWQLWILLNCHMAPNEMSGSATGRKKIRIQIHFLEAWCAYWSLKENHPLCAMRAHDVYWLRWLPSLNTSSSSIIYLGVWVLWHHFLLVCVIQIKAGQGNRGVMSSVGCLNMMPNSSSPAVHK